MSIFLTFGTIAALTMGKFDEMEDMTMRGLTMELDKEYIDKLIKMIRTHKPDWSTLTDNEIVDLAIYHYGGTVPKALIDALYNALA